MSVLFGVWVVRHEGAGAEIEVEEFGGGVNAKAAKRRRVKGAGDPYEVREGKRGAFDIDGEATKVI